MSNPVLDLLATRRSTKAAMFSEPGPSANELDRILAIAARVPDHKRVVPWRFIVFQGEARARFGEVLSRVTAANEKDASPVRLETERGRFLRAPVVVAVISRVVPTPGAPEWEQVLSCGAAAMNLCLAANASGFGTCWITEWYAYDPDVAKALKLAPNERVAGFVYMGTAKEKQPDRDRPVMTEIVSRWQG
jgi:nitroreductase